MAGLVPATHVGPMPQLLEANSPLLDVGDRDKPGHDDSGQDRSQGSEIMLEIKNLHASVEDKEILKGISLSVKPGEIHAIMGPNGSGKSTLASVLSGRDGYTIPAGSVEYLGQDLLALDADERARAGIFLAFQYPVEIPGVNNMYFLRAAVNAVRKARGESDLDAGQFLKIVRQTLKLLDMPEALLNRAVNVGFS